MAILETFDEQHVTPALHLLTIDDRLTHLRLPLAQSARANGALARERRGEALAIYREAVKAFRRAVGISRRVQSLPLPPRDREVGHHARASRATSQVKASELTRAHPQLTPREREVTELVAQGLSNRDIAQELVIEQGTVANHVAHILCKCGASNRTQVAALVLSSNESL
jgi:DNA-binding NarL/FixJ family response regulator